MTTTRTTHQQHNNKQTMKMDKIHNAVSLLIDGHLMFISMYWEKRKQFNL